MYPSQSDAKNSLQYNQTGSAGLDTARGVQERQSQVAAELERMEKFIEEHNILNANLCQRLSPVLLQKAETSGTGSTAPESAKAPLADTLARFNDQLYRLICSYRGILASLEL